MSWGADIADAIIAVDEAIAKFEETIRHSGDQHVLDTVAYVAMRQLIEGLQATAIGDEGQRFDSLEEARQFRAPRCWGTNSVVPNYTSQKVVEYYDATCGNTAPHDSHVI